MQKKYRYVQVNIPVETWFRLINEAEEKSLPVGKVFAKILGLKGTVRLKILENIKNK